VALARIPKADLDALMMMKDFGTAQGQRIQICVRV